MQRMEAIEVLAGFKGEGLSVATMRAIPDWYAQGAAPEHWGLVFLGTVVAAVVSFAAVRWFLRYVQSHTFEGFGWYRIALGILILVLFRR